MKTQDFTDDLDGAAKALQSGGLVAVPTETVYGLAACGFDEKAVAAVYEVKGRPEQKPLSLMVSGKDAMDALCENVPPMAKKLADVYWPGPLTIVLKAKPVIPDIVRAGGSTVGLRCPDHPKLRALLEKVDFPLAAPSANPSGEKSPVTAAEVWSYFDGKIDGVIDGGKCTLGKESTLIDLSKTPYTVLREGAVSILELNMMLVANLTVIGITGGTGCGKTTALDAVRELGGLVIDCDEVYHRLLREPGKMRDAIEARFPGALTPGSDDTKALGEIVFKDPAALAELNAITNQCVGDEMNRMLLAGARNGVMLAAIDAISLIESGVGAMCTATVGVTAPREVRVERLMKRDGIDRKYAELRIDAQKPDSFFEENCAHVLVNDTTREAFHDKSKQLFEDIIRRNS